MTSDADVWQLSPCNVTVIAKPVFTRETSVQIDIHIIHMLTLPPSVPLMKRVPIT